MAFPCSHSSPCGSCFHHSSSDIVIHRLFPNSEILLGPGFPLCSAFHQGAEPAEDSETDNSSVSPECPQKPDWPSGPFVPDDGTRPDIEEEWMWKMHLLSPYREDYTFLKHFASGGQGALLKMANKQGQVVAVKVMKATRTLDDAVREINALKSVSDCPNAVQMLTFGTGPSVDRMGMMLANIVMRFCSGGDLMALNRRRRYAEAQIPEYWLWKFYADMARALTFLHEGPTNRKSGEAWDPMIHCDIKPENWLLDFEPDAEGKLQPKIVLSDFGLMHTKTELAALADEYGYIEHPFGTAQWWPPEAVSAKLSCRYTEAADVYSMGACAQYLALGCGALVRGAKFDELSGNELNQQAISRTRLRVYLADLDVCRFYLGDSLEGQGVVPVDRVRPYSFVLADIVWLAMEDVNLRANASAIMRLLEYGLKIVLDEEAPEWFCGEWEPSDNGDEETL